MLFAIKVLKNNKAQLLHFMKAFLRFVHMCWVCECLFASECWIKNLGFPGDMKVENVPYFKSEEVDSFLTPLLK